MNNEFIYGIFDEVQNTYNNCFSAKNDVVATRFYLSMKPQIGEHLYCLGVFATASGIIESTEKQRVPIEEIIAKFEKLRADQQSRVDAANEKFGGESIED